MQSAAKAPSYYGVLALCLWSKQVEIFRKSQLRKTKTSCIMKYRDFEIDVLILRNCVMHVALLSSFFFIHDIFYVHLDFHGRNSNCWVFMGMRVPP